MRKYSDVLKSLRINKGIPQKALAQLLDITVRQYQRYEGGDQEPNIHNLIALADYFNVSLDYLVGRSDDPSRH